jgi:hypothetical protein
MESNHTLKNILQSAANMEHVGENLYATSCLNPRVTARYPDDASALAFPKSIQLAAEYKIEDHSGFTRDLRFVSK